MNNRILWAGILALVVSCPARAASLTLLPDWFVAPTVRDLFMLPDGKTFTGVDGTDVFRWSPTEGRTDLGVIPATTGALDLPVSVTAVSDDGSTIIGYVGHQFQAVAGFMWTVESGMVIMPNSLDETIRHAIPTAVSADGKVIVGGARQDALDPLGGGTPVAFRWTPTTGTTSLGFAGSPAAITPDGATIVGSRAATDPFSEAFRWNEQDGLQGLGFLSTGEWKSSHAQFVSNDGNTVIGFSFPENLTAGPKVFRWNKLEGMQPLSDLADTQSPVGIAADANVVLGNMQHFAGGGIGPYIPFLWTPTDGLRPLSELLALHGLNNEYPLSEINKSHSISSISADGRIIFGISTLAVGGGTIFDPIPTYSYETWLLDLSHVPEPSTFLLGVVSLLFFVLRFAPCRRRGCRRC